MKNVNLKRAIDYSLPILINFNFRIRESVRLSVYIDVFYIVNEAVVRHKL